MEAWSATQWSDGIEPVNRFDPITSQCYVWGFHYALGSHFRFPLTFDEQLGAMGQFAKDDLRILSFGYREK